jgi:hypothetical protein
MFPDDLQENAKFLVGMMKDIIADIKRTAGTGFLSGSVAVHLTDTLAKIAYQYNRSPQYRSVTAVKSGINELQMQLCDLFMDGEPFGVMLFRDTFKGLWNAGKMIGKGMKTKEALSEKILYNGKQTVLGEVLDNVNFSLYTSGRAGYSKVTEIDFVDMDLPQIAISLRDIMADKALPKLCEPFKDKLSSIIFENAQFVGSLERTGVKSKFVNPQKQQNISLYAN